MESANPEEGDLDGLSMLRDRSCLLNSRVLQTPSRGPAAALMKGAWWP
jgi:hypothetical protein